MQSNVNLKNLSNTFDILPREIKMLIFHFFLSVEDLMVCSQVSKQWRDLLNEQQMWKLRFDRDSKRWNCIENRQQLESSSKQQSTSSSSSTSTASTITSFFDSFLDILTLSPSNLNNSKKELTNVNATASASSPSIDWKRLYLVQSRANNQRTYKKKQQPQR